MTKYLFLGAAYLIGAAAAAAQMPGADPAVDLPKTPVGNALGEFLGAYNRSDSTELRAFYLKYGLDRAMDAVLSRRQATGGYDLVAIEKSRPRLIEFVARERATRRLAFGVAELSLEGQPVALRQWTIQPVPPGGTVADFKIDAATRARVIAQAIAYLDTNYVFPDVAARMGAAVRRRFQQGEYDDVSNGISFALLLTDHFREISHDLHLRVGFTAEQVPASPGPPGQPGPPSPTMRQQLLSQNCWFRAVEVQPGNIGYLKFDQFWSPDVCGEIASQAMNKLADTDALIVDLRDNGGGDPAMVAYVSSYLFDARTHLNDVWTRRTNETRESWTHEVPGTRFGGTKPVYVLTSVRTFSGAEEFSYNLKSLKRATIIGEQTGGGAHPTNGFRIDSHFEIRVPFARSINPISKTNWEGTGVTPDVRVVASQALDTARALIARHARAPSEALNAPTMRDHGTESSAVVSVERRAGAMQSLKAVAGVQKSQRQKCTRASPKCAC